MHLGYVWVTGHQGQRLWSMILRMKHGANLGAVLNIKLRSGTVLWWEREDKGHSVGSIEAGLQKETPKGNTD